MKFEKRAVDVTFSISSRILDSRKIIGILMSVIIWNYLRFFLFFFWVVFVGVCWVFMWVVKLFSRSLHDLNNSNIFLEYKDGLMKVGIFCFVAVGSVLLLH